MNNEEPLMDERTLLLWWTLWGVNSVNHDVDALVSKVSLGVNEERTIDVWDSSILFAGRTVVDSRSTEL